MLPCDIPFLKGARITFRLPYSFSLAEFMFFRPSR
nr:MAG TPA: hypothetical protein [Bacteriophage sp.]